MENLIDKFNDLSDKLKQIYSEKDSSKSEIVLFYQLFFKHCDEEILRKIIDDFENEIRKY